ncbi:hypothetical protein H5410_015617 [Solanum commersonii]|uniref:Phosphatidic acid phosphatase type 2/haloperoxidase domain-containing protein n=1 Tax=Solanum commersonii TaxID=4109 RepID=A0A9J5ZU91_SOLCO|nr:hypothetical protein H5410_015617 [Solanum commersonii]
MESIPRWEVLSLCGIGTWVILSSMFNVTQKIRSLTQPWVSSYVVSTTPITLMIQKYHNKYLDAFFSALSCVVSVPFYTAFLPLLFWSGHCKLARQMTLLMALCDYIGNCIKDVVCAPRPSAPPVRRITATEDEKENALEYGLPSSHTLNTVCLSGFLLQYILSYTQNDDAITGLAGLVIVCLFVFFIALGRIYLGMHSLIDIIAGLAFGLAILASWLSVHKYIDYFIVSGQNGPGNALEVPEAERFASFWAVLCFLLLFAYPTPQLPTPSFEFHTAFNGVALGIVIGVHQTYHQFHHESVPRVFTPQLTLPAFLGRLIVGYPTILLVRFCSKALAKWMLPMLANALGIPVRSSSYVPSLSVSASAKKLDQIKQAGYIQKLFFFSRQDLFEVDTGIRLFQYATLAWSVVDLVPSLFFHLGL